MTEEVRDVPTRELDLTAPGKSIFEKIDECQEQLDAHLARHPVECNLVHVFSHKKLSVYFVRCEFWS